MDIDPADALDAQGPLDWAKMYRKIDGKPFSLDKFRPLEQLYADPHPHIVIIKPAQRGVSEYAINYAGFALDRGAAVWTAGEKEGLNVAYIFPKKEALGDFSKERLSGLQNETGYLERLFGDDEFNAITFKQVGGSYLYLRGGWSTSALKSFPADVLVLDEYDEMAASAIALARRRLNASLVRRELDISTPSWPNRGIHAMYLESDRHVYQQQHDCGEWVQYDFLRDTRVDNLPYDEWQRYPAEQIRRLVVTLVCPSCAGIVTDEQRIARGRWISEAPDVIGLRGYWIPPLAFPFVDMMRLATGAVNPDPSEREQFFQSDLGLPYNLAGTKITVEMILQMAAGLENGQLPGNGRGPWRDTTMGVDVGARWHWRVSSTGPDGRRYVRAVGAALDWDDLDGLMAHFRVRCCIVDALPELDGSKRFSARWPGRVLRAFYPGASALKGQMFHSDGIARKRVKGKLKPLGSDVVQINRTMAMDRVYATVARADELWATDVVHDPELQAHLIAPTRSAGVGAHGQNVADWVHASPDHLFHACVYDIIARALLPPEQQTFSGAAGGPKIALDAPKTSRFQTAKLPDAPGASAPTISRTMRLRGLLSGAKRGTMGSSFGAPLSGLRSASSRPGGRRRRSL